VPIDLEQLKKFRKQGLSVRQIGGLMGVSKSGIGAALQRLSETSGNASNNPPE
jgi:predicted transcriptional regulator